MYDVIHHSCQKVVALVLSSPTNLRLIPGRPQSEAVPSLLESVKLLVDIPTVAPGKCSENF
jgi:hypothetical protein